MILTAQLFINDRCDGGPIALRQARTDLRIADPKTAETPLDEPERGSDRVVFGEHAFAAPVKLRVGVDDREVCGGPSDFGSRDAPELRAVSFWGEQVCVVRLGELLLDRQRDSLAHGALAVAAVDNHVEAAIKRESEKIAGDYVHASCRSSSGAPE